MSNTAEYGEYVSSKRILETNTKEEMKVALTDVQSGMFKMQ